MTGRRLRLLGVAGSVRSGSYNRSLLRAALSVCPADVEPTTFDLARLPVYNEDKRTPAPTVVRRWKQAIERADVMLISTPEYNNSVPGVLKNAIDWASRPPEDSPLAGKPVGIIGATDGPWGTVRAQQHLRLVLASTGSIVMVRPVVFVPFAARVMDETGELADGETSSRLARFVEALADWGRLFPSG